ncbi:MAG: hypothetical protein ABEJ89_01620 [Haloarculaceae archaeon]
MAESGVPEARDTAGTPLAGVADMEPILVLVGCAAVAVGTFLPWASFQGVSVAGYESSYGLLSLAIALVVPIQGVVLGWSRRAMLVAAVMGVVPFVLALSVLPVASVGAYLALLGGLAMSIGGYVGYRKWAVHGTEDAQ